MKLKQSATSPRWHSELKGVLAGESASFVVTGECMAPLIIDGMRVTVSGQSGYWPGDIVVAQSADGRYLAHRVLGGGWWRGQWRYVTCADATHRIDGAISNEGILGRVIAGDCRAEVSVISLRQRVKSLCKFVAVVVCYAVNSRW